jgi:deoxyribose-phosphate aldolase
MSTFVTEIDLLRPDVTRAQLEAAAADARARSAVVLVVHSCWTRLAADLLGGSGTRLGVLVGAPGGASTTLAKMFESDQAIEAGARRIESPLNVGALKSGLLEFVKDDIAGVLNSCRRIKRKQAELYVRLDLSLIDATEQRLAAEIVRAVHADGVSLTHAGAPVTADDVGRLRAALGPEIAIKVCGANLDEAALRAAGATSFAA